MVEKILNDAIRSAGGKRKFNDRFNQSFNNYEFIESHREELLREYNGEWIAVYNSTVIAHDKKYNVLICRIEENGYHMEDTTLKFITDKESTTLY